MQDNASGHSDKATITDMRSREVIPIFWPAKSPDLNPIKTVWDWIKDYIQEKYPNIHSSYPRLKGAVIEAWNSISDKQVKDLIKTMYNRC